MDDSIKPVYLFADSQLLFWEDERGLFMRRVREHLSAAAPKAAYLGASNRDRPEFYDIFVAAMNNIGVTNCRLIPSRPSLEDVRFLEQADLILLAGGDVKRGWDVFVDNGFDELLPQRYYDGALLMGVSAGALQLGKRAWSGHEPTEYNLFPTLKLVPLVLSVHERSDWPNLRKLVELSGGITEGVGIPAGGGLIYHPEHTLEPVRYPAYSIWLNEGEITESLLVPWKEEGVQSAPTVLSPTEIIDPRNQH